MVASTLMVTLLLAPPPYPPHFSSLHLSRGSGDKGHLRCGSLRIIYTPWKRRCWRLPVLLWEILVNVQAVERFPVNVIAIILPHGYSPIKIIKKKQTRHCLHSLYHHSILTVLVTTRCATGPSTMMVVTGLLMVTTSEVCVLPFVRLQVNTMATGAQSFFTPTDRWAVEFLRSCTSFSSDALHISVLPSDVLPISVLP